MNGNPRLTVFMPVYNGETYVGEAIESILRQTYTDFRFIIINDGSTDRTEGVINAYRDPRITLVTHDTNLGIPRTRNHGLDLAEGHYLALMDSDDIANRRRLESQVAFLDNNQGVGICGTWYNKLLGSEKSETRFPVRHEEIVFQMLFANAFGQNTVMLRRSFIEKHCLRYDINFPYSEDYEFWVRCSKYMRLANLPETHVIYRYHPGNSSNRFSEEMAHHADRVRVMHFNNLELYPTKSELQLHLDLLNFRFNGELERLADTRDWLAKLLALGKRHYGVAEAEVHPHLARYWYGACARSAHLGWRTWQLFRSSPIGRAASWEWQWKLLLRCATRHPVV